MTLQIDQQLRSNDCGISAVKTICNLLKVDMPRSYISSQMPLTAEGASLDAIEQFFKKNGFTTKFHLIDVNQLGKELHLLKSQFPCLVPVKVRRGLHYVIIKDYKNSHLEIGDPAKSKSYKLSLEAFKQRAFYTQSVLDIRELKTVLDLKVKDELKKLQFQLPDFLTEKDQVNTFNKLTYFSYLQENFGFKNKKTEQAFLKDLLLYQEIQSIPNNFKNLNQNGDKKISIRSPVLLSVKVTDHIKPPSDNQEQNIYWRLFKSIKGIRQLWTMFLTTTIIAGLITYLAVFINQVLIDHILPSYQLSVLLLFALGVGIFYLFDIVFGSFKSYISIHLGNILDEYFIGLFDQKLNNYSIRFLHSFRRGDLTERLKDSMKIKSFFLTFFSKIFINVVIALFSIAILVAINWKLSLIVLLVLGIFTTMFLGLTPIVKRLEQQRFSIKAEFYSRFIEKIEAMQVIRTMRLESYSSSEIIGSMKQMINVRTKAKLVSLFNSSFSSILVSLSTLLIIVLTSRQMILYQSITLGMIITFVALSGKIFRAFRSLLDYNLSLQEHAVILLRFFDFEETDQPTNGQLPEQQKLHQLHFKSLSFRDLAYAYVDEKYILKDLNFTILRGEKIWIQGKNGSGKSTLCKIMGMLYAPDRGEILINNVDANLYDTELLRSQITLISAEDVLFNDTLIFNICFGRHIDMNKLIYYARAIDFYEFIQKQPNRFNMLIHENGRNLSTGQRKKVLLLRALMMDSSVIILDEIFNGLDYESKLKVENVFNEIENRSFIIISHMPVEGIHFNKKYNLKNGRLFDQCTET